MDKEEIDLRTLDSERTAKSKDRDEKSQTSVNLDSELKCRRLLEDIVAAEDILRDLNYDLFQLAILTEQETRRIKSCYERLVPSIRAAVLHPLIGDKKDMLKTKLRNYCEEFIELVDQRIMPHFWVAVPIKANFLRLKADYLRYLFEIFPKSGSYQIRAHNAYTETKAFFLANRMNKTPEWFRLRLNYAALLYLDGFPTAAMFVCQQLLKSAKSKMIDTAMERRIRRNVDFFKRICMK